MRRRARPWLLALMGLSGCSRATPDVEPTGAPPERTVTVTTDLVYREGSHHPKHRLDLYRPAGGSVAPVVVFFHGGYWTSGDRNAPEHGQGLYRSLGEHLASRGIVTIIPSYRLAPEVGIEAMVEDVSHAIAWTHHHVLDRGGDPRRVFLMGHSAGGHLAALLCGHPAWLTRRGLEPRALRGCVILSGIWDVEDMARSHNQRFNDGITRPTFGDDPEAWRRWSPIATLEAPRPMLLILAERDFDYLKPQAQAAMEALGAAGGEARLTIALGEDHLDLVRRFGEPGDPVSDWVVDFVRQGG
ncbi:MAG: alpha/beta hydrolase [Myxococcales bacterium]|nr:alpha/beta hydrolase [Myxococcales bacterium]